MMTLYIYLYVSIITLSLLAVLVYFMYYVCFSVDDDIDETKEYYEMIVRNNEFIPRCIINVDAELNYETEKITVEILKKKFNNRIITKNIKNLIEKNDIYENTVTGNRLYEMLEEKNDMHKDKELNKNTLFNEFINLVRHGSFKKQSILSSMNNTIRNQKRSKSENDLIYLYQPTKNYDSICPKNKHNIKGKFVTFL
jgi:hypothetical protein